MHHRWQSNQWCQHTVPNETVDRLSRGFIQTVSQHSRSNQIRPSKTTAKTAVSTYRQAQKRASTLSSLTDICQPHYCVELPRLPDMQVHKFTPCLVSLFMSPYLWLQGLLAPTPHSLPTVCKGGESEDCEGRGGEAKRGGKRRTG